MNNSLKETVREHTLLVKRIANHLLMKLPSHIQVDDLIQAGMIGLMEAAEHFDPDKGACFSTYAGIRIRGAMLDEIRKGDWAPRSVHRNARKILEATRALEHKTGRDVRDKEIADDLGVSIQDYHKMMHDTNAVKMCFFEDWNYNDDFPLQQSHVDQMNLLDNLQTDYFRKALTHHISSLPERESLVLSLYYDEDLNLKEVGDILGVSESRVSQIHSQAMRRLKVLLKDWNK